MNILCYIGIKTCVSGFDYSQAAGVFFSWQNVLQVAGIIFAFTQFMEANKFRVYIFNLGSLKKETCYAVFSSIVLVVFAYLLPVMQEFSSADPVPVISYPASFELFSLLLISVLFGRYVIYLLSPKRFIPKLSSNLIESIGAELMRDLSTENIVAISHIIDFHLKDIIYLASKVDRYDQKSEQELDGRKDPSLSEFCLDFIDVDLSNSNYIEHLAVRDLRSLLRIIKYVDEYHLWRAGGNIFFDNLAGRLLSDGQSLLSKEQRFCGYSGVYKPISKLLFNSPGIIAHYNVLDPTWDFRGDPEVLLDNKIEGLNMALRNYYSKKQGVGFPDTPNLKLGCVIESLSHSLESCLMEICRFGDEIYKNKHKLEISRILGFFRDLENILYPSKLYHHRPVFSDDEENLQKHTVTEAVTRSLFDILAAFAWVDHQEYVRSKILDLCWVFHSFKSNKAMNNIRHKLLSYVQDRIKQNIQGKYPSMIRLFINLYGYRFHEEKIDDASIFESSVRELFKQSIAVRMINDESFASKHLPPGWIVSKENRKVIDLRGKVAFSLSTDR